MPEIKPFRQETEYDCYLTCVSIITGLSKEVLYDELGVNTDGRGFKGVFCPEMTLLLTSLGYAHISVPALIAYDGDMIKTYPKHEEILEIFVFQGYHPLLIVRKFGAKNSDNTHAIVWSNILDCWYDPLTGGAVDWDRYEILDVEGIKYVEKK